MENLLENEADLFESDRLAFSDGSIFTHLIEDRSLVLGLSVESLPRPYDGRENGSKFNPNSNIETLNKASIDSTHIIISVDDCLEYVSEILSEGVEVQHTYIGTGETYTRTKNLSGNQKLVIDASTNEIVIDEAERNNICSSNKLQFSYIERDEVNGAHGKRTRRYVQIYANAKMLGSRYFEGLTMDNYKIIQDKIESTEIIKFKKGKSLLDGRIEDTDIKVDAYMSNDSFSNEISTRRKTAKSSIMFKATDSKKNQMWQFGERSLQSNNVKDSNKTKAIEYVFIKKYNKLIECTSVNSTNLFIEKFGLSDHLTNDNGDCLIRTEFTLNSRKDYERVGLCMFSEGKGRVKLGEVLSTLHNYQSLYIESINRIDEAYFYQETVLSEDEIMDDILKRKSNTKLISDKLLLIIIKHTFRMVAFLGASFEFALSDALDHVTAKEGTDRYKKSVSHLEKVVSETYDRAFEYKMMINKN